MASANLIVGQNCLEIKDMQQANGADVRCLGAGQGILDGQAKGLTNVATMIAVGWRGGFFLAGSKSGGYKTVWAMGGGCSGWGKTKWGGVTLTANGARS